MLPLQSRASTLKLKIRQENMKGEAGYLALNSAIANFLLPTFRRRI